MTRPPTLAPLIARDSEEDTAAFELEVTILIDYNANNTNKTENDAVIRDITQDIINNYINKIANSSNNTIIHVIISNIENKEYDIVLISNYTTDSKHIAVKLEVLFEDKLETELLSMFLLSQNITQLYCFYN